MTSSAPPNTTALMLESLESELQVSLGGIDAPYRALDDMVRHHFGWDSPSAEARGKRVRPLLTLLCTRAAGGDWRRALPAAAAVELIHNFTLIHDDIEDGSATRRGRPTVWSLWGVPQAVNTGDFVYVASHLSCARLRQRGLPAEVVLAAREELDRACLRLTRGQHLDLLFEAQEDVTAEAYLEMISGKTAALVGGACGLGALIAGAEGDPLEAYRQFGWNLGMAFQLLDDWIGIWGDPGQTGKSDSDDLRQGKKTYPVLLGLQESPAFASAWSAGGRESADIAALQASLASAGVDTATRDLAGGYTEAAMNALRASQGVSEALAELESLALRLLHRDR